MAMTVRFFAILLCLIVWSSVSYADDEPRIFKLLPFLRYDINSSYVAKGPTNFSIKPYIKTKQATTQFQYNDTVSGDHYSFRISDKASLYSGLEVGYKGFTFGYDVNTNYLFGHHKRAGYDFNCSVYGQSAGCDFFFSTDNKAIVKNEKFKKLYDEPVDCFSTSRMQASLYYVLKKDIFSMPAVFNESFVQKKTAGSLIFDANITNTLIILNSSKAPEALSELLSQSTMFSHFRQSMLCVGCGYGRNVVLKHFLIHWSAQPSVPLYMSKKIVDVCGNTYSTSDWGLNLNAKLRGAVLWVFDRHSVNLNLVADVNMIDQGALQAVDAFIRGYLSYRILFGKKIRH